MARLKQTHGIYASRFSGCEPRCRLVPRRVKSTFRQSPICHLQEVLLGLTDLEGLTFGVTRWSLYSGLLMRLTAHDCFLLRLLVNGPWCIGCVMSTGGSCGGLCGVVFGVLVVLYCFNTGLHVAGNRWASSRVLRVSALFSISMASRIILLVKCCMLAIVLVLSKSMLCPVSRKWLVKEDDVSFCFTARMCSCLRTSMRLLD